MVARQGLYGWAPYGPGIVSADLIKDPQTLRISTKLNGQTVQVSRLWHYIHLARDGECRDGGPAANQDQESNTSDMIFNVKQTISFLSRGTTLLPGDVIFTGTPSGVGMGRDPKLWLKDGDVVEVALEGVGTCTNKVEFDKVEAKL